MKTKLLNSLLSFSGVPLAFTYWVFDTLLDVSVFKTQPDFISSFLTTNSHELWMRFSVSALIIAFVIYINKSKKEIQQKSDDAEELKYLETNDPLTSLFNKRKLYEVLEYEMEKEKRYKAGLSIIFCSIDNFKRINTSYKPDIVDDLLRSVALQLAVCLRKSDIISHWEDEKFLILISNKNANETKIIAEKIRNTMENFKFDEIGNITSSLGITQFIDDDNKVTIVNRADDALKTAIEKSGNLVEVL